MRFDTGIHPRQWHRGAWLVAFVLAVLVLLLTHRPTGGRAFAMTLDPTPDPSSGTPTPSGGTPSPPEDPAWPIPDPAPAPTAPPVQESPPPDDTGSAPPAGEAPPSAQEGPAPAAAPATPPATPPAGPKTGYVSEIVDSVFTVGPAEFFALDLPTNQPDAKADHLFGTVTTKGRKDIVVRLFRSSDYDRWLKQKSGRKPVAFWTSQRSSSLTLDQDLPAGVPVVLLLDNGYSIRTSKQVVCQLQLRYQRNGTQTFDTEAGGKIAGSGVGSKTGKTDDNLPAPRSNSDQEMPPPPPPPPSGY